LTFLVPFASAALGSEFWTALSTAAANLAANPSNGADGVAEDRSSLPPACLSKKRSGISRIKWSTSAEFGDSSFFAVSERLGCCVPSATFESGAFALGVAAAVAVDIGPELAGIDCVVGTFARNERFVALMTKNDNTSDADAAPIIRDGDIAAFR